MKLSREHDLTPFQLHTASTLALPAFCSTFGKTQIHEQVAIAAPKLMSDKQFSSHTLLCFYCQERRASWVLIQSSYLSFLEGTEEQVAD